jgi:hypothetical protein
MFKNLFIIPLATASHFDEQLSIYQYENSGYSMFEYLYTFENSEQGYKGLFPPQFPKIFEDQVEWFTLDLV